MHQGVSLPLRGPKPTTLLAALLLANGNVVSTERLIHILWPYHAPNTATALIHTYISTLRKILRANTGRNGPNIFTQAPGYRLETGDSQVDLLEFNTVSNKARKAYDANQTADAAVLAEHALKLRRGPVLGGAVGEYMAIEVARIDELILSIEELRAAAHISQGNAAAIVPTLMSLVDENPLRETFRGQLMVALSQVGNIPGALRAYRQGYTMMVDELGIQPGAQLRAIHESLLRTSAL
ncbi:AfsR/SARP family transcriptional regulator [Amycolatopsis plumensis]|uniref:BTAD domain-containing putative transcriptional regulator n=1 Tax=Amycolatopsis plumensis TaxID=236508 RepID=A0ABV5ULL5_9PSEU